MLKNKKKIIILFMFALLCILGFIFSVLIENSSVDALSKYGSRGNEVTQIQTKLKKWGYYTGSVDRNLWK